MSKRKVLVLAQRLGATVEFARDNYPGRGGVTKDDQLMVDAPDGYRWCVEEVHQLVETAPRGDKEIWASMHSRMLWGTEPCPADCDCREEVDDG